MEYESIESKRVTGELLMNMVDYGIWIVEGWLERSAKIKMNCWGSMRHVGMFQLNTGCKHLSCKWTSNAGVETGWIRREHIGAREYEGIEYKRGTGEFLTDMVDYGIWIVEGWLERSGMIKMNCWGSMRHCGDVSKKHSLLTSFL